jgi:protein O-mannosyl-transferase
MTTELISWKADLQRGMEEVRVGHYDKGLRFFERAYQSNPNEPEVQLVLGRERLRQGLLSDAERLLHSVHSKRPQSLAAAAAYSRLLGLHLKQPERAFDVIHQALAHHPQAPELQVIRGELLLEGGSFLEARAAFGQVLDLHATDDAARYGMARTYNMEGIIQGQIGDFERASFSFKRAMDLAPNWSGPCVNFGVVLGRLGSLTRAIEVYHQALERDPTNAVATFNLGIAYYEQGEGDEALCVLQQLLETVPDYPGLHVTLGNILAKMEDFDRAIAFFLEALEIDEDSPTTWSSLGLAYVCSGNLERGEECLKRALRVDAGYLNALYNLAMVYVTQERLEEAEQILHQAFRLDPKRTVDILADDSGFKAIRQTDHLAFLG